MKAKRVTVMAMCIALAMILSYVESQIPSPGIPGVKLGLANIVVIFALYKLGWKEAVGISLLRVLLVSLLFGHVASFFYSIAGAALSLAGMILLKKTEKLSCVAVSVLGGVLHNLPSYYLRPLCNTVIGINVSPSKLGPIKLDVKSLAYRTYKIMTMRNVEADKHLCDLLVDIVSIQGHSTFDTKAARKIAQKGYFETMKILKNSQLIKDITQ